MHEDHAELLIVEANGPLLSLTLNNGKANALSLALMGALKSAIENAADDPAIRIITIRHKGKIFSAGHDLKELTAHRADSDGGLAFFEQTFGLCAGMMQTIMACPKPVVAVVNGLATAAGCQLVATCDLAIATDIATFCTPGVNIGLFCSTPMVALTRATHRKQAMEMLLTGEVIDASSAKEYGLINRIVPDEYLEMVVQKYVDSITAKSAHVVKIGKQAFYQQAEMSVADAYKFTSAVMVENMLAGDAKEGISAFMEKRHPDWSHS